MAQNPGTAATAARGRKRRHAVRTIELGYHEVIPQVHLTWLAHRDLGVKMTECYKYYS